MHMSDRANPMHVFTEVIPIEFNSKVSWYTAAAQLKLFITPSTMEINYPFLSTF